MKNVRIYTTRFCGFCTAAKRLLEQRGVPFEEVDVSGDRAARTRLLELTGRHTVPQIFIGEEPIGGFTDLAALDAGGELSARLEG